MEMQFLWQQNNAQGTIIVINKDQTTDSLIVLTLRGPSVLSASSLSLELHNTPTPSLVMLASTFNILLQQASSPSSCKIGTSSQTVLIICLIKVLLSCRQVFYYC